MLRSKMAFLQPAAEHRFAAGNEGYSGFAMTSSLGNPSHSRYKLYFRFATS
jgi:hypothetical protein